MKVILLADVKKQGKKDEIINVSDGYAKYLINNKLGVPANESNKKILDKDLEKRKEQEDKRIEEAKKLKDKLEKENISFKVKTGAQDRVFGNVSAKQIHEELKKLGYDIDKKKIIIKNNLDSIGVHNVEIELHKKVTCNIKVTLRK